MIISFILACLALIGLDLLSEAWTKKMQDEERKEVKEKEDKAQSARKCASTQASLPLRPRVAT